jgi:hypothetical protein
MITDPIEFRAWQIQHYSQRLSEAKTTEEKAFLRRELFNLKKTVDNGSDHDRGVSSVLAIQAFA